MDYLASLHRLEGVLRETALGGLASSQQLTDLLQQASPTTGDLWGDVEIALRSLLVAMINEMEPRAPFTEESPAIKLIKLSIDYSLGLDAACSLPKVAFLLIEDLLESQTIQQAKTIWKIVESWIDQLTNEVLFSKGKFTMLKTCNSLLRKLSKSCDTEFCGRILLFLATIYPISERSAVNLMGKVNVNNVTYYEPQEIFDQSMIDMDTKKSDNIVGEDGEEVEVKGLVLSYELYSKFWKLQSYFAAESKHFDEPKDFWNEFMTHARLVIDTLERAGHGDEPSVSVPSCSSSSSSSSSVGGGAGHTHVHGHGHGRPAASRLDEEASGFKFLTSSQLFGLQCRDPQFRQQISVQLLFFAHHFKAKLLPTVDAGDKKAEFVKDIAFLELSAEKMIAGPVGAGQDLAQTVRRILERENHWIRWKAAACTPFERGPDVSGEKRKLDDALPTSMLRPLKVTALPMARHAFDCSDGNVKRIAQQLAAARPDFEEQIIKYLDAEDPDAGIDEEYHPKNDQLYCWRTRRLLAEQGLGTFKVMLDGDLGKGLRKLKNLPEPVPVEPSIDEDDEDVTMDDGSATGEAKASDSMEMDVEGSVAEGSTLTEELTATVTNPDVDEGSVTEPASLVEEEAAHKTPPSAEGMVIGSEAGEVDADPESAANEEKAMEPEQQ